MKTVRDILDGFSKAAEAILGPIAEDIKKISDGAIAAGVNITECAVEETLNEILALPNVFQSQMEKCIDTVTKNANKTMEDGEKQVSYDHMQIQSL